MNYKQLVKMCALILNINMPFPSSSFLGIQLEVDVAPHSRSSYTLDANWAPYQGTEYRSFPERHIISLQVQPTQY